MNNRIQMNKKSLALSLIGLALVLTASWGSLPQPASASPKKGAALFVQAEAAQGFAAPGNAAPANFLVVVTDPETGAPITGLVQSDFTIINQFGIPGQACGFSNNITSFIDVVSGAYRIQVGLVSCTWVPGDYLAQVIVNAEAGRGQAPATLSIKCQQECSR